MNLNQSEAFIQAHRKIIFIIEIDYNENNETVYVTVNVDNWSFYRITGHSIE